MLLFDAAHEIDSYHRRLAEAAVLEDRRRMARDLHDGLAQELAFIAASGDDARARGSPPLLAAFSVRQFLLGGARPEVPAARLVG